MKTLQDIQHHIIKLSKSPNVPDADDSTLVVVLSELIHDYQTRLRDEQLAMLYGIAAALLRRVPLPVPDVVLPDGQRGYTSETVARHIGVPVEQIHQAIETGELDERDLLTPNTANCLLNPPSDKLH